MCTNNWAESTTDGFRDETRRNLIHSNKTQWLIGGMKIWHKLNVSTLIEIFWSNLTLEQNSSWIWLSAGTPILVLSTLLYSELALECWQKVKSKNYFAKMSNSTTKFLSVYKLKILLIYYFWFWQFLSSYELFSLEDSVVFRLITCNFFWTFKQFKWNLYFYVSGQSGPFWAGLKLP